MAVDRLKSILIKVIGSNKNLLDIAATNSASILAACFEIAELGLDPSIMNEVFIVPYKNEAKCQTGYKGLMKLAVEAARDAGLPITVLRADTIHESDKYERTFGDKPRVIHEPPPFGKERGEIMGFVAVAKDKAGKVNFREMTVKEVADHQRRFCRSMKNPNSPFYNGQNFESYGLKTVIRRLVQKDLPMSSKLSKAIALDDEAEALEPGKVLEFPALTVETQSSEEEVVADEATTESPS